MVVMQMSIQRLRERGYISFFPQTSQKLEYSIHSTKYIWVALALGSTLLAGDAYWNTHTQHTHTHTHTHTYIYIYIHVVMKLCTQIE